MNKRNEGLVGVDITCKAYIMAGMTERTNADIFFLEL